MFISCLTHLYDVCCSYRFTFLQTLQSYYLSFSPSKCMAEKGELGEAMSRNNGKDHKVHLLLVIVQRIPAIVALCTSQWSVYFWPTVFLLGS